MKTINVKDYAEELGVPISAVRSMIRQGVIPARKVGKQWRINYVRAEQILSEQMEKNLAKVETVTDIRKVLLERLNYERI